MLCYAMLRYATSMVRPWFSTFVFCVASSYRIFPVCVQIITKYSIMEPAFYYYLLSFDLSIIVIIVIMFWILDGILAVVLSFIFHPSIHSLNASVPHLLIE